MSVKRDNITNLTAVEESDICFLFLGDITMTEQLMLRAKIDVVVDLESNFSFLSGLNT